MQNFAIVAIVAQYRVFFFHAQFSPFKTKSLSKSGQQMSAIDIFRYKTL